MAVQLIFPREEFAEDVIIFAGRSAQLGSAAAVRLQAESGTLAISTAVLAPRHLLDQTPTVLALRAVSVDPELRCDITVSADALISRSGTTIALPEAGVRAAWAGVSPPRSGWEPTAVISSPLVREQAREGSAQLAAELPMDAGEDVMQITRQRVWAHPETRFGGLPRGVAFAASAMGFVRGSDAEQAQVFQCGPWSRVSFERGHVLVRTPA